MRLNHVLLCLLAVGILACALTGCTGGGAAEDPVGAHGQLTVTDGTLTDAQGQPVQLRGMSTHGIAWYPEFLNTGAFQAVRSAGGNVIRLAMYTDTENGYLADPETNFERLTTGVDLAKELGMYVILDWHILSDGDPNAHVDEAVAFFGRVAERYADDPAVLYEICNEPNGVDWAAIRRYAERVIPVIRAQAKDALILVGTPNYSGDLSGPLLDPLPYDNLLYAYHFYAGMHPNYEALVAARSRNLPVFVSEWGISEDDTGSPALAAGRDFADYLNENGLSWCAWSLCTKDEVFSALKPDAAPDGNWTEADLTEVGQVLFAALQGGSV